MDSLSNSDTEPAVPATVKVIVDFVLLIVVGLPIVIFKFGIYPFKRGFFCDDESIAHPHMPSTITDAMLISISLIVTSIGIIIAEVIIYKRTARCRNYQRSGRYVVGKTVEVHPLVSQLYKGLGMFLFTAAACQSSTDIIKYSLGRLRPHFLAVCKPDYSRFNCTDEYGRYVYVTEDVCTGDPKEIQEARLSHPSGHASFSLCCFLFLTFYLQSKLKWKGSKLLKPLLQIILIYMALYTGLSRISDYHHHWSDVLGGFVVGFVVTCLCVFSLSELFKGPSMKEISQKLTEVRQLIRMSAARGSVIEMQHQQNNFNGQQSAAILLNNENAQELGTA